MITYQDYERADNKTKWLQSALSTYRGSKEYKRARNVHRITSIVIECALIVAIFSSLVMIARPYRMESINQGVRKRDIFLCMDNGIYLDTLNEELSPLGVAVIVEAQHLCMTMRGAKANSAMTRTSALRGIAKSDPRTRQELMSLLKE